jgi:hypothetical protein
VCVCVCVVCVCVVLFGWHTKSLSMAILDHLVVANLVWFLLASLTVIKQTVLGIYRNTITPHNILHPIYLLDVQQIVKCHYTNNNMTAPVTPLTPMCNNAQSVNMNDS